MVKHQIVTWSPVSSKKGGEKPPNSYYYRRLVGVTTESLMFDHGRIITLRPLLCETVVDRIVMRISTSLYTKTESLALV